MRIVIDANVVISFLLTRGETVSSIFDAWEKEIFNVLIDVEVVTELEEVIRRFVRKELVDPFDAEAMIRRLHQNTVRVRTKSLVEVSKDDKDNRYLACAKDGDADYLVTGDAKHLLPLKKFGKTKIISPKEFRKIIS